MKLLHFGLFNKNEPQQALRDALKGICNRYAEFSWVLNQKTADRELNSLIVRHGPDVVFMQIQTPGIITSLTLKKYPRIKFFNFSGDVRPVIDPWYYQVAPYCTTLFTNTDWVADFMSKGFKARYFQIGFDHNIYNPLGPVRGTGPVVFMGNNHGSKFPLSKLREQMVERFLPTHFFAAYGRGWPDCLDLNYRQQTEAAIYRGSMIGINLSHMDLGSYTSDRMFRLMACGTMCLAYKHKDIEKEFNDGVHLETWTTLDELNELIEHYLHSHNYRKQKADAGCEYVHLNYTWPARLKKDLIPLL